MCWLFKRCPGFGFSEPQLSRRILEMNMKIFDRPLGRHAWGFLLLGLLVAPNQLNAEVVTNFQVASQWGEIREDGVRPALAGHRFLNAAGGETNNPSDAYFRFDVSALKADLDSQFGAGVWTLSNVEISLTQSNFTGSTAGGVRLFHVQDDLVAITSGQAGDGSGDDFSGLDTSTLLYGEWATLNLGNGGNQILDYTFNPTATGDVDTYGVADGMQIGSLSNWIASNDSLTFVLVADDATLATYKGNEFGDRLPPQIRLTAVPEPGSAMALVLASATVLVRSRKRRVC